MRQHLVGGLAGREHELVEQVVRAVAERELLLDATPSRADERAPQRETAGVGIEVELRQRRRQRRERARRRAERVLVRRDLDRPGDPELALELLDRLTGLVDVELCGHGRARSRRSRRGTLHAGAVRDGNARVRPARSIVPSAMRRSDCPGSCLAAVLSFRRSRARTTARSPDYQERGWAWMFLASFGFGFLTSLTPCVYPMIPITLAIFGARGDNVTQGPRDRARDRLRRRHGPDLRDRSA